MTTPCCILALVPWHPSRFASRGVAIDESVKLVIPEAIWISAAALCPVLILLGIWLLLRFRRYWREFDILQVQGGIFSQLRIIWAEMKWLFRVGLAGLVLMLVGVTSGCFAWSSREYSLLLTRDGLSERHGDVTTLYQWTDAKQLSGRIRSTDFWILFEKDGHECRAHFQQRELGEPLQDKAISIAEQELGKLIHLPGEPLYK